MELKQVKATNGWVNIVTHDDGSEEMSVHPNSLKLVEAIKALLTEEEKPKLPSLDHEDDL